MLVEHEQRMTAGASKVAVVGGPLLLTMGAALETVHVQDQLVQRNAVLNQVDSGAGQIHQCRQVLP